MNEDERFYCALNKQSQPVSRGQDVGKRRRRPAEGRALFPNCPTKTRPPAYATLQNLFDPCGAPFNAKLCANSRLAASPVERASGALQACSQSILHSSGRPSQMLETRHHCNAHTTHARTHLAGLAAVESSANHTQRHKDNKTLFLKSRCLPHPSRYSFSHHIVSFLPSKSLVFFFRLQYYIKTHNQPRLRLSIPLPLALDPTTCARPP